VGSPPPYKRAGSNSFTRTQIKGSVNWHHGATTDGRRHLPSAETPGTRDPAHVVGMEVGREPGRRDNDPVGDNVLSMSPAIIIWMNDVVMS
jgi:hypothetical protein